jgi:hypothetical protein
MAEIDYIKEIDYWLNQLRGEVGDLKYMAEIDYSKKIINNRSNVLILYIRALRDKLQNG